MTNDVLVDTSVWIAYFRKGNSDAALLLDSLIATDQVLLCGVVEMELLRGVRPHEQTDLEQRLEALRWVEIERQDWQHAGHLMNTLRQHGITVSATDALIASVCLKRNLPLLTLDRDFEAFKGLERLPIPLT